MLAEAQSNRSLSPCSMPALPAQVPILNGSNSPLFFILMVLIHHYSSKSSNRRLRAQSLADLLLHGNQQAIDILCQTTSASHFQSLNKWIYLMPQKTTIRHFLQPVEKLNQSNYSSTTLTLSRLPMKAGYFKPCSREAASILVIQSWKSKNSYLRW